MGLKLRDTTQDVSEAFKAALILRRDGKMDPLTENMLGTVIYNIARWAVADSARVSLDDEDLISDIQLHLLTKIDKADLNRHGKAILVYLKHAADRKIIDIYRAAHRQKRTGELVELEPFTVACDIFGRIIEKQ